MNNVMDKQDQATSGGLVTRARLALASKVAMVASVAVVGISGGMAGAVTYDPTTDATGAASSAGTLAGPVIAAVFAGVVGLFVLKWAISYIRGILHSR